MKPRVLVVDDDPLFLGTMRRLLVPQHDVETVSNGRAALELLQRDAPPYDVILCDLMMPQMTGMDLHAELARTAPELLDRLVFVTANVFDGGAQAFLDGVPNSRLSKPFCMQEMRAIVAARACHAPAAAATG